MSVVSDSGPPITGGVGLSNNTKSDFFTNDNEKSIETYRIVL